MRAEFIEISAPTLPFHWRSQRSLYFVSSVHLTLLLILLLLYSSIPLLQASNTTKNPSLSLLLLLLRILVEMEVTAAVSKSIASPCLFSSNPSFSRPNLYLQSSFNSSHSQPKRSSFSPLSLSISSNPSFHLHLKKKVSGSSRSFITRSSLDDASHSADEAIPIEKSMMSFFFFWFDSFDFFRLS